MTTLLSVERVQARAAEQDVVAGLAEQDVGPGAADEEVVAAAAVAGQRERAGQETAAVEDVVARQSVDVKGIVGGFGVLDVHPGGDADHRDAIDVTDHSGDVVAVGPLDGDRVGLAIARYAIRRGEISCDLARSVPLRSCWVMASAPPKARTL